MTTSTAAAAVGARATVPSHRRASLLAALFGVVLAVAVVSWWANRPTGGAGAVATGVGQLAGLATSVFALATVVLMARVPVIDAVLGADRGLVWHRRAAVATVVLLAVHVVGIVAGYAASDGTGLGSELATLVTKYPDMLTASVGAVLLLTITVGSIGSVRRLVGYESWLFAHWYLYPAVALAFGHELSDGASFVHASWPTLVWTWLHLFVLGLLAWYRAALPAWRIARHPTRVARVRHEGPDAVSVTLAGDHLDDYGARAGQHLRLRFLTRKGWWQSHPFSLSSAPTPTRLRVTVAASGDFTRSLQALRPGTRVLVSGAYGNLTADARRTDRVLLVGGGSGITPLRALFEAFGPEVDARLLYRARRSDAIVLGSELDRIARARGTHVDYVVGPRDPDPHRDVTSPRGLRRLYPDLAARDVYVCGTNGFVERITSSLRAVGVSATRVHTERFDP